MAKTRKKPLKKNTGFNKKEFGLFMLVFAVIGVFTLLVSFAAPVPPASLTVTPNPGSPGISETFSGCGYYANSYTTIEVFSPIGAGWFGDNSDSSGCINIAHNINSVKGNYKVDAWQSLPNNYRKSKVMGTTTYNVQ